MTTIAFDGKTIACDSQATIDECIKYRVDKHAAIGQVDIWVAGDLSKKQKFVDSLKYYKGKDLCIDSEEFEDIDAFIFYRPSRKLYIFLGKDLVIEATDRFALGSGRDFAIAAMSCGLNATEAVLKASELDLYTDSNIKTFDLKKKAFV